MMTNKIRPGKLHHARIPVAKVIAPDITLRYWHILRVSEQFSATFDP
jgi:hypothetical protein